MYLYNILEITTFYKTNRELEFKPSLQIFHWKKIFMCRKNCKKTCSQQNFTNHFNLGNIIVNNICRKKITILNVHCKKYIYF